MQFLSQIMTAASGSVGGVTFTRNRYSSLVARARAIPVNVANNALEVTRARFGSDAIRWRSLTSDQRLAWTNFAKDTPWTNKLGQTINLTGQAMYIAQVGRFRGIYPDSSPDYYDDCTCAPGLAPQPLVTIDCCTNPDIGLVVTVQNQHDTLAMSFAVRISAPQNPSKNFYKGPYTGLSQVVIAALAAGATDTAEFCDLCAAMYFVEVVGVQDPPNVNICSPVRQSFYACTLAP